MLSKLTNCAISLLLVHVCTANFSCTYLLDSYNINILVKLRTQAIVSEKARKPKSVSGLDASVTCVTFTDSLQ